MRRIADFLTFATGILGIALVGCEPGGVGDPCIPEDEYRTTFSGFSETQVNVESRSFQCETRVCLVEHFRGRVSCPYGSQPGDGPANECRIPGTSGGPGNVVEVPVPAQLHARAPQDSVYCSCRCKGPDSEARYCECPPGFKCTELIDNIGKDLGVGLEQLAGSYCVKDGQHIEDPLKIPAQPCLTGAADQDGDCGPRHQGTYWD